MTGYACSETKVKKRLEPESPGENESGTEWNGMVNREHADGTESGNGSVLHEMVRECTFGLA